MTMAREQELPLFAVIAWDAPGAEAARLAVREAHFRHIEATMASIAIAGPLRDAAGSFAGSLLILRAADAAAARALVEADPYFTAGVWADIRIEAFTAAAGDWIGGKIW